MKKKILALAIGGVLSAGAQAAISDILITEYVEPDGGNNKAIELTNYGTDDFTFPADIYITKQVNGDPAKWYASQASDKSSILDGVTIAAGKSLVIINSNSDDLIKAEIAINKAKSIESSNISHNGNDALALVKIKDLVPLATSNKVAPENQEILDVVGNVDSSTAWGENVTLRRKTTALTQATDYEADDWDSKVNEKNKGNYSGLGTKPGEDVDRAPAPVPGPGDFSCGTAAEHPRTAIEAIQGTGDKSPLITSGYSSKDKYYVEGVVTALTDSPKRGFFLYQAGTDKLSSDGIFVKTDASKLADLPIKVGQTVCINSKVYEDYNMTRLFAKKTEIEITDATENKPTAVDLEIISADITEDKGTFRNTLERYEGMLVTFPAQREDNGDLKKDADGKLIPADINSTTSEIEDMRVSRTFSFDYGSFRNNMVLSYKRPNMHPNQEHVAGTLEAKKYAEQSDDYSLIVEAKVKPADGEIPFYPAFTTDAANNYIRINDSVTGMEGVIIYSYGAYNFVVTDNVTSENFKHNTDRIAGLVDGDEDETSNAFTRTLASVASGDIEIKVATQNVLNYFNSPFGGAYNEHGDNRGATSYSEYEKQKAKIVAAIRGLDADIVGLMEIENNGFGETSAIKELVDEVNLYYDEVKRSKREQNNSSSNRYAFIGFDSNGDVVIDGYDSIGSDAITTGMLYRPEKVTLDAVKIIPMPSQHDEPVVNDNGIVVKNYTDEALESGDNYMRDSLAATFIVNQTGKKLTVAVNHLKSKGSTCAEDWDGVDFGTTEKLGFNKDKALLPNSDFQGSCENFRVAAAVQLGEELDKISGDKVIVGDMNSYAQEDPMLVLTTIPNIEGKTITAARNTFIGREPQFGANGAVITKDYGYVNAVSMKDAQKGKMSWSYSYEDEIGSLDHILINEELKDRVVDAADWHINAAESPLYDYNEDRKGVHAKAFFQPDAYRSSDHDSAIMVLGYTPGETDSGQPVHLAISSGFVDVPYTIPAKAEAKAGDIAEIILSNQDNDVYVDMSKVTSPRVALTADGQKVVNLELRGAKPSTYTVTMTLKRDGKVVPNSTVAMDVEVAKADSLAPKVVVPEYDETGGSFGMFSIMSLLGLGFLRRKTK